MAQGGLQLCFSKSRKSNHPLCFKRGSGEGASSFPLIFKGGAEAVIRVPWGPQSYTCHTYDAYHDIAFQANGRFANGTGTIVSQTDGGTEIVFRIKVSSGPAVFEISANSSTPCTATSEDPGVKCSVLANQTGAAPKMKKSISVPRIETTPSPSVTRVNFNASCKLVSIT